MGSISSLIYFNEFGKKISNKITSIKKISELTNYKDLLNTLKKNKIIQMIDGCYKLGSKKINLKKNFLSLTN